MRVLVVDGSAAVAVRLVSHLREVGLEVVAMAGSAAAALAQAEVHSPDAIVVDPQLPDHHGPEILSAFEQRVPAAVLVVMTNDPNARFRHRCLELGADYFFDKSNEFEALVVALVNAAAQLERS